MDWESVSFFFYTGELKIQTETRFQYSGFFFKVEVADFMVRIYLYFILPHFAQLHRGNFLPTLQMNIVPESLSLIRQPT